MAEFTETIYRRWHVVTHVANQGEGRWTGYYQAMLAAAGHLQLHSGIAPCRYYTSQQDTEAALLQDARAYIDEWPE